MMYACSLWNQRPFALSLQKFAQLPHLNLGVQELIMSQKGGLLGVPHLVPLGSRGHVSFEPHTLESCL